MIEHSTIFCKKGMCLPLFFEQYLSLEQVLYEFPYVAASALMFF